MHGTIKESTQTVGRGACASCASCRYHLESFMSYLFSLTRWVPTQLSPQQNRKGDNTKNDTQNSVHTRGFA